MYQRSHLDVVSQRTKCLPCISFCKINTLTEAELWLALKSLLLYCPVYNSHVYILYDHAMYGWRTSRLIKEINYCLNWLTRLMLHLSYKLWLRATDGRPHYKMLKEGTRHTHCTETVQSSPMEVCRIACVTIIRIHVWSSIKPDGPWRFSALDIRTRDGDDWKGIQDPWTQGATVERCCAVSAQCLKLICLWQHS